MSAEEIQLPRGDVTEGVVRVGDTVRRPHQDTSDGVAAYLRHLEAAGFDCAPRYLGRDSKGRDILTYLDGAVADDNDLPTWAAADEVLPGVAHLLRTLHDASANFRPTEPMRPVHPDRPKPRFPALEPLIIAQRDVTPGNTVFRNGVAWGLIDFDLSDWTTRSLDLANTATHWVPLRDPVDWQPVHAGIDVGARLRLMLDAYGRDVVSAAQLLDACELRFAGGYDAMRWNAENLGGGWSRMWREGVGDVIRRRVSWFASVRSELAAALNDGVNLVVIIDFLTTAGFDVRLEPIDHDTVLPGVTVDRGSLVVDEAKLAHVGDVLHEAGHVAITPSDERFALGRNVGADGGNEMAAIAWSYAAARHLNIDPNVVFHAEGYLGGARSLLENFGQGRYVGVPMLAWRGLTTERDYPAMARWLAQ